ncbi:hypothetical protein KR093_000636, partial [Drosophila rubida]
VVSLLLLACRMQATFGEATTSAIIAAVLRHTTEKNVIFSPLLLTESLRQMNLAAEGKTAEEIAKVLHLTGKASSEILEDFSNATGLANISETQNLHFANRLFLAFDIKLLPEYQQKESEMFANQSQSVNFANSSETINKINTWLADASNNTITKLVENVAAETKALSLGAIYFKGFWKYAFDSQNTSKAKFQIPQKSGQARKIDVDMMFRKALCRLNEIDKLDAMSLEIPYDDTELSLVVLLPKTVNGIDKIINNLDQMDSADISPKTPAMYVQVYLPKFKLDVELTLNEALKSLGLVQIFQKANFSAMTDSQADLKLDRILQKSIVEVAEEGSSA